MIPYLKFSTSHTWWFNQTLRQLQANFTMKLVLVDVPDPA